MPNPSHAVSIINEEDLFQAEPINWVNIIFVPFNRNFQTVVLVCAFLKILTGPTQAVTPMIDCLPIMDEIFVLKLLKVMIVYVADYVYIIDICLHIAHRQVHEQAMRREHPAKPGVLLSLDMIAALPLYDFFSNDNCPLVEFWPNILCFNDVPLLYRFVEYFSLVTTHSVGNLCVGTLVVIVLLMTSSGMLTVLITKQCPDCDAHNLTSWLVCIEQRFEPGTSIEVQRITTMFYAIQVSCEYFFGIRLDPSLTMRRILSLVWVVALSTIGFLIIKYLVEPKVFAEYVLAQRRLHAFHARAARIVLETRRRHPNPAAALTVQKYFSVVWRHRKGLTSMPKIYNTLPMCIQVTVAMDLSWALFYHSPNLRRCSVPFRRWVSMRAELTYRMPDELFYVGPHCFSNMYYLRTGVVQFLSTDDMISPMLSVSGGTVLGDVSYYLPPKRRSVVLRCRTYCEVLMISRRDLLTALHLFPEDRRLILQLTRNRIEHARALYAHKVKQYGSKCSVDEDIAWIKLRWWQLAKAFRKWKQSKKDHSMTLPEEHSSCHCAKYIGQLVLSSELQLQTNSMFVIETFPWVLSPRSSFQKNWQRVVRVTLLFVLVVYPPNLTALSWPTWFDGLGFCCDQVFNADVFVGLVTARENDLEASAQHGRIATMLSKAKSFTFLLDVLSTNWFDSFFVSKLCYFNRFLKLYLLFSGASKTNWKADYDPTAEVLIRIALLHAIFTAYVWPYFIVEFVTELSLYLSVDFWVGPFCSPTHDSREICKTKPGNHFSIPMAFLVESNFAEPKPGEFWDSALLCFVCFKRCIMPMVLSLSLTSVLYLKYKHVFEFQDFVMTSRDLFVRCKLHPDLLSRSLRFMECHWKYFRGMDVMHGPPLKDEPYDIYMKLHGHAAERLIQNSEAFKGVSMAMVREMALKARFLILPKGSSIFLFGVKCDKLAWIFQGVVLCDSHDGSSEQSAAVLESTDPIEHAAVLLQRPAMRTYTTATDCELLYIDAQEFRDLLSTFKEEHRHFEMVRETVGPIFDRLLYRSIKKHREYQQKLRSKVLRARKSNVGLKGVMAAGLNASGAGGEEDDILSTLFLFLSSFRKEPESAFMQVWMFARTFAVFVSLIVSSCRGFVNSATRFYVEGLMSYSRYFCGATIVIMLFLPYYDERGLIERRISKTAYRYVSRSFWLDLLLFVPWRTVLYLEEGEENSFRLLMMTMLWTCQLYYLIGYFDYLTDSSTSHTIILSFIKWAMVSLCLLFSGGHFFFFQCTDMKGSDAVWKVGTCWLVLDKELDGQVIPFYKSSDLVINDLVTMYLCSINFAQVAVTSVIAALPLGYTVVIPSILFVPYMAFGVVRSSVDSILIARMVLGSRGNTLFMHSLQQLNRFLESERIERPLIDRTLDYLGYDYYRESGVDMSWLGARVGVLFRQDMQFFFYKQTFMALDTMLKGGEPLMRELAGHVKVTHYLPNSDVVREMDLVHFVYIVHRGKAIVTRHGMKIAILSKGCLFGQLDGPKLRPLNISARCDDYLDVLTVPLRVFHDVLPKEVLERIMSSPNVARDILILSKAVAENPYNTVRYIMRGDVVVKLPFMRKPLEAQKCAWLYRWLVLTHVVGPLFAIALVPMIGVLMHKESLIIVELMIATDVLHFLHIVTQFFKMELVVNKKKLEMVNMWLSIIKSPFLYVDLISLILPIFTLLTNILYFQYGRLLRIYLVVVIYKRFSKSIKANCLLTFVRLLSVVLVIHIFTCGCIHVSCRREEMDEVAPEMEYLYVVDPFVASSIESTEWISLKDVEAHFANNESAIHIGCETALINFKGDELIHTVVFSRLWYLDYVLSLNFIVGIFIGYSNAVLCPDSHIELLYKIVTTFCLGLLYYWVATNAMITTITKFHELYDYDFYVAHILDYMTHNKVSSSVIQNVKSYIEMQWKRQKGAWLPEIVKQSPLCLREDLFSSLYMHHLMGCPVYRDLPEYFRRQLVTRVERVLLLPGRYIVKEGDVCPRQYFIHEGEVEKWCTDTSSGDERLVSVLTTMGFFGVVAGLFPEVPFSCSYYTRTVVDIVFLRHENWKDLLTAYPDIRQKMYSQANKFREETHKFQKRKMSDHKHVYE